jgi:hypothetical protein
VARECLGNFVVVVFDVENAPDAALRAGVPVVSWIRRPADDAAQMSDVLNGHARDTTRGFSRNQSYAPPSREGDGLGTRRAVV